MGTSREQAIKAAGQAFAEAYQLLDELPVEEAARRAYTPTGPPLAELEARIRARRAKRHNDAA
ncbi:hypothetical protein [Pseudactinotalea sp. Z1732]|uniref:hypothetical protein n=1 Tax=Micrococcales TaxID=85006 RepID=UPI003C7B6403